jgi:hypothetical protein
VPLIGWRNNQLIIPSQTVPCEPHHQRRPRLQVASVKQGRVDVLFPCGVWGLLPFGGS